MSTALTMFSTAVLAAQNAPAAPPISSEPSAVPFDVPARAFDCHLVDADGKVLQLKFSMPGIVKGVPYYARAKISIESTTGRYAGSKMAGLLRMPEDRAVWFEIWLNVKGADVIEGVQITVPRHGTARAELSTSYSSPLERKTTAIGLCKFEKSA